MTLAQYIPQDILDRYEVHNFRHAAEVLSATCTSEMSEIFAALRGFSIECADLTKGGGNESDIPKKLSSLLRPLKWFETRIHGDLVVVIETAGAAGTTSSQVKIENYVDGHKVDYVKNGVAFDLEWNSKDQTFDRDLYAFRAFHEAGIISAAILLTRSESLNEVFKSLGVMKKYGASTTWMGKLLYRIKAGRNGACPVLVFGISQKVISDWKP